MDDNYLAALAADQVPFGETLATQVADGLEKGKSIGFSHRDYCGMGMEVNGQGQYCYGELWDGIMEKPALLKSKASFITWLAVQSTASLARLDESEQFYRGNQVITRKMLEDFVRFNAS